MIIASTEAKDSRSINKTDRDGILPFRQQGIEDLLN
jgi:hypothetical protein